MYNAICFKDHNGYGILVEINNKNKEVSYYVRDYNYTPYNYWVYLYGVYDSEKCEIFKRFIDDRDITDKIRSELYQAVKYFVEEIETVDYAN